jgi:hypothetical protein
MREQVKMARGGTKMRREQYRWNEMRKEQYGWNEYEEKAV